MFDRSQLPTYCDQHVLIADGREYILKAANSPPAREGLSTAIKNVCVQHASRKMGETIFNESRTGEYRVALEYEYSPKVVGFINQPPSIEVKRTFKNGRKQRGSYIPDFLVIESDGPYIVQVKLSSTVEAEIRKNPADWSRNELGEAVYRPATEAFAAIGLKHRVVEADRFSAVRGENLRQLLQARYAENAVTEALLKRVQNALKHHAFMRLQALAETVEIVDELPLIQLIERGALVSFLSDELLSKSESAWVSLSLAGLHAAREIHEQQSASDLACVSSDMVPTSAAVSRAFEIFDSIQRGKNNRTLRYWKQRIREGAKAGRSAIESCIRKRAGNGDIKIPPEAKQLLDEFIEEIYAKQSIGICAAHAEYRRFVKSRSTIPYFVHRKTLLRHIARHDREAIAFGQGGRRAANAAQSPSPINTREIPATRPFARASADHYLADEYVVILETNDYRFEAKPWITILVDSYSGAILAIWVSLRPPSRRATAILLRRCVREHGRLPESIVLDHGADFISNFLRFLLARYGVTVAWRPIAHGRYGSEVERTAGSIRTRFHSHRKGNTVMKAQVRSVSKSHSPQARASSSLQDFLTDLLRYVDLANETLLGTKPFSPKLMLSRGLAKFSVCGIRVEYNHRFVVESSVEAHEYSVDPTSGIYNGVHHYWHPDLSRLAGQGKKAEVREDPEDPNKVYALVQGQWVTCSATGAIVPAVDAVSQLAASIQQLDVRTLRQMAREAAEDRLLTENAAVENARALAKTQATPVMPHVEVKPAPIPDMRSIERPALAVTKWEYPDALG